MSLRSNSLGLATALVALAVSAASAQSDRRSSIKVNLLADSPVSLISAGWGESRMTERGGAVVLTLDTTLSLKNSGTRRIRAMTWLVVTNEVTPGGKASVTKASLDIGPSETFPLKIDLRLLRPLAGGDGPQVEVSLDGVLFEDLSFYGPDRLESRRAMTAFELEAQRDRSYFLAILRDGGVDALREACLESTARQERSPRWNVQWAGSRRGPSTASAALPEKRIELAFVNLPDAPVIAGNGDAILSGSSARAPRFEITNRSRKPVKYVEMGWILGDGEGRDFVAGSLPAHLELAPGAKTSVSEKAGFDVSDPAGAPVSLAGMTGFVRHVQFADGQVWIPARQSGRSLTVSPEEARLTAIYRKRGIAGLTAELRKFSK